MRAPDFWWHKRPNLTAWLLKPFGHIYGSITAFRMRITPSSANSAQTVICIGNFTAGGAGKTPVAIALAKLLQDNNISACFLSRGYGGKLALPTLVDAAYHNAVEVGDEPLLLAQIAPTIVSRNRASGLFLCKNTRTDVIIMDDGLQNSSIRKDLSFAVVEAKVGIGNGLCVPAGPLRAPVSRQWPFVQAIITIGREHGADALKQEAQAYSVPAFEVHLETPSNIISTLRNKHILAYCSLGRPDKFFQYLRQIGGSIASEHRFPDHHYFTENEAAHLLNIAQEKHLSLFTTHKDFVRLPRHAQEGSALATLKARSRVVPISAVFQNEHQVLDLVKSSIRFKTASGPA